MYVLQLFNAKTTEADNQTESSKIIDCLEFSTDGQAEPAEHAILANDVKLREMATHFLKEVNCFYCHNVDSFILDPQSIMNSNLEADQHSKGTRICLHMFCTFLSNYRITKSNMIKYSSASMIYLYYWYICDIIYIDTRSIILV